MAATAEQGGPAAARGGPSAVDRKQSSTSSAETEATEQSAANQVAKHCTLISVSVNRRSATDSSVGRLVSHSIRSEILRGAPLSKILKPFLWAVSPVDLKPQARSDLWNISQQCPTLDTFISQTWVTPGWQKYLALLAHYYGKPVKAICVGASMALLALDMLGVSPTLPPEYKQRWCWEGEVIVAPGSILVPVMGLAMLYLAPKIWHSQRTVFLDAVCINQVEEELKAEGVNSLSGFVAKSDELLVLWSTSYLGRAWCVYELAMFLALKGKDGKITICPIFQHIMVIAAQQVMTIIVVAKHYAIVWYGHHGIINSADELLLIACMCWPPVLVMSHVWRLYVAQKHDMDLQLASFDIAQADCREAADKEFILARVEFWLGSEAHFNEYVRTVLKDLVDAMLPGAGLCYVDILWMCWPLFLHGTAMLCAYWRSDMSLHAWLSDLTSFLGMFLFAWPVLFKIYIAGLMRCPRRRTSCIANAAMSVLVSLGFLLGVVAILFTREASMSLWRLGEFKGGNQDENQGEPTHWHPVEHQGGHQGQPQDGDRGDDGHWGSLAYFALTGLAAAALFRAEWLALLRGSHSPARAASAPQVRSKGAPMWSPEAGAPDPDEVCASGAGARQAPRTALDAALPSRAGSAHGQDHVCDPEAEPAAALHAEILGRGAELRSARL